MIKKIIDAIDCLVQEIYSVDQEKLNDYFLILADCFLEFVKYMEERNYFVNIDKEIALIQTAFTKRDYVELADVLLYKIKPEFVSLQAEFEK